MINKIGTAICFIFLGVYAFRPHPKIKANSCGRVCAICPRGFINNVHWHTYQDSTDNQQWAEYVNDAAGGYCSVDWKWGTTGKRSY
jgi:hypothetical protein